ncbi:hypothetical protein BGZ83_008884 [Gryganskiella cystojenkinii]|nr:hypothetical protein BGZ83_008884 [Gryganskiella cystojenkinii]
MATTTSPPPPPGSATAAAPADKGSTTTSHEDIKTYQDGPTVWIPTLGKLKGQVETIAGQPYPVATFFNVPFGTVTHRWRPAVKASSWEGLRDATKFGPSPPQQTKNHPFVKVFSGLAEQVDYEQSQNELNCLNCNVFMPSKVALESRIGIETDAGKQIERYIGHPTSLPVLVWIVGGALKTGSNSTPLYDGTELVRTSIERGTPMIYVSLNYRLNNFGFLSSKELVQATKEAQGHEDLASKEWYAESVGNWGLLDVALGLQWIQDHIVAFGGDPKRVTVMGEAAGASVISYLQQIPKFHGLFDRSILQSGAASSIPPVYPEHEGQQYFNDLCNGFDINLNQGSSPEEIVEKLRAIPERDLAEIMNDSKTLFFRPTIDGVVLKDDCRVHTQDPTRYDPKLNWVLIGTCGEEGTALNPQLGATTLETFAKLKARICGPDPTEGEIFDQLYGVPASDRQAYRVSSKVLGHGNFKFPATQASEAILNHPICQLSRYHFDRKTDKIESMIPGLGAHQGVDLYFVFGDRSVTASLLSPEEMDFVKKVQEAWIEFTTAKSPEASSLIPKVNYVIPLTAEDKEVLQIDEDPKDALVFGQDLQVGKGVVERMSREEIEFWKRSHAHAAEQACNGKGSEYGFDFFRPL